MPRTLVALFALGALIGLAPAAPVPKHLMPNEPLYYAVRQGTRWVYTDYGADYEYEATEVQPLVSGATVLTLTQIDGDHKRPYRKIEVSARGVVWLETGGSAFDTPVCVLRCPIKPGNEWSFTSSGADHIAPARGTMKVAGTEEVKVPAGAFTAVRVEEKRTLLLDNGKPKLTYHVTSWYAPNVGQIKWASEKSERVLKSFAPGKG
ncbi:: DUF3108 [Gemmata massiliana]|uniref:: DUF3108 n=1 Tax=Gemmata massiliana TaxID=1210884 RepID=A0A6P2CY16_9BACT|nr:hypothetical protein [Gemmata massiliana]VTR93276.1 : DUF3108 [Gemmata massiliana]